jgi:hypothetical protein
MTDPPPISDATILEALAKWLDFVRPDQDNQMQADLRRIAARLRTLDGQEAK